MAAPAQRTGLTSSRRGRCTGISGRKRGGVMTSANGTSASQSDKHAAIDYLKRLKAGEKAERPAIHDAQMAKEIELVEHYVALAKGDKAALDRAYTGLAMTEGSRGKKVHPLFAEVVAEEEESTRDLEFPDEAALSTCAPLPESARLPASASNGASPWLDEYIAFSRKWSPRAYDDFHEAVGLWILSTVAARRVILPHGGKRYTPLFIALCARTSLYSKSTTADIGLSVLQASGLDWMLAPDESTPQKFLQSLAGRLPADYGSLLPSEQEQVKCQLALSGQRGWFYEEFGQHLAAMSRENGMMADFKGIIRRLDDCREKYSRETIARGTETISNPYVVLLVGLTPADIRPYAKAGESMWHDGFWARFAFVTPRQDSPKIDRFPQGYRSVPSTLALPLRAWHDRLEMPDVTITEVSEGVYSWKREKLPECRINWSEEAYEAYYAYDIALMLASLQNAECIQMCHWARAQEITERWRANLHSLYEAVNQAEVTASEQMEDKIIQVTMRLRWATAREISQYIRGLDTATARAKAEELVRAGVLEKIKAGKTEKYAVVGSVDTGSLQHQTAQGVV